MTNLFQLRFKPLLIDIGKEREELYRRLQNQITRCEAIINSATTSVETKLAAMKKLADLVRAAGDILEQAQLDQLEREVKELEELVGKEEQERKQRQQAPTWA